MDDKLTAGQCIVREWINLGDEGPSRLAARIDAAIAEALKERKEQLYQRNVDCFELVQENKRLIDTFAEAQQWRVAFLEAIPETWGEICKKLGAMPPCQPHEWDNRTSLENAVWALVTATTLAKELAEAQRDTERLDWLISKGCHFTPGLTFYKEADSGKGMHFKPGSAREAIDAARAKGKEGK